MPPPPTPLHLPLAPEAIWSLSHAPDTRFSPNPAWMEKPTPPQVIRNPPDAGTLLRRQLCSLFLLAVAVVLFLAFGAMRSVFWGIAGVCVIAILAVWGICTLFRFVPRITPVEAKRYARIYHRFTPQLTPQFDDMGPKQILAKLAQMSEKIVEQTTRVRSLLQEGHITQEQHDQWLVDLMDFVNQHSTKKAQ
jgi:hypothetical protein